MLLGSLQVLGVQQGEPERLVDERRTVAPRGLAVSRCPLQQVERLPVQVQRLAEPPLPPADEAEIAQTVGDLHRVGLGQPPQPQQRLVGGLGRPLEVTEFPQNPPQLHAALQRAGVSVAVQAQSYLERVLGETAGLGQLGAEHLEAG